MLQQLRAPGLTEFIGMDLRIGGHARVQEVYEVDYDDDQPPFFPLKAMYDKATGTLEGLSAPYNAMADVAPQGLADMDSNDVPSQEDNHLLGPVTGPETETVTIKKQLGFKVPAQADQGVHAGHTVADR